MKKIFEFLNVFGYKQKYNDLYNKIQKKINYFENQITIHEKYKCYVELAKDKEFLILLKDLIEGESKDE